jgi:hypothetical protein
VSMSRCPCERNARIIATCTIMQRYGIVAKQMARIAAYRIGALRLPRKSHGPEDRSHRRPVPLIPLRRFLSNRYWCTKNACRLRRLLGRCCRPCSIHRYARESWQGRTEHGRGGARPVREDRRIRVFCTLCT